MKRTFKTLALAAAITASTAAAAHASSTGMPWDTFGTSIISALSSKFTLAICVVAIVGIGCGLAFGEGGGMTQKFLKVGMGISIIVGAGSVAANFFGASGCLF